MRATTRAEQEWQRRLNMLPPHLARHLVRVQEQVCWLRQWYREHPEQVDCLHDIHVTRARRRWWWTHALKETEG